MFNFQEPTVQTQSLPTRLNVPQDPTQGVEVTIKNYEYFPANGNTLEKAILTVEDSQGVPHYHDFVLPTSDNQTAFRLTEFQHLGNETGLAPEQKLNFTSYKEACDYYLTPLLGGKGRWKIVYSKNEVVYDPKDEKLVGKTIDEVKRLRKPYPKSGSFPYFLGESNKKSFTIVSKGAKYDDFVDYTIIAKQSDDEVSFNVSTSDEPEF